MASIYAEININAPQSEVFHLAQDYDLRLSWDPFLSDLKFVSQDKTMKKGLQVWVKAKNGREMTVEYISYTPPKHVSMKMINGPLFFSHFSGVWIFEKQEENVTRVIFKYKFKMKWLFWLGTAITRKILLRNMNQRLVALKKVYDTK